MVWNFRSRALKRFFLRGDPRRIPAEHRQAVRDAFTRLNAATVPEDLNLPGFALHPLRGDHAGYRAISVGRNRRIVFRLAEGGVADVNYLDYH